MLAALPGYRRSTRYKSSDGSKPRHLALHEVDDVDAFMRAGDVLNTDRTKRVLGGAKTYESLTWQLILNKGKPDEKLGE
jgi:reverse gyrase